MILQGVGAEGADWRPALGISVCNRDDVRILSQQLLQNMIPWPFE